MICRIWHGWTTPGEADAYERLVRGEICAAIEARSIDGYRGLDLLRRTTGAETEFVTMIWFESFDGVRAFAGDEFERAVVPPAARALLTRWDEHVAHYEVRREARPRQ